MTEQEAIAILESLTPAEFDQLRRDVDTELMRKSLYHFVLGAWSTVEPATPFTNNWHIKAICDHVQAVLEGPERDGPWAQNLLINVPPGTAKSLLTSVFAPAWQWLRVPGWRAAFLCANPRVSLRDAVKCRNLVDSSWYKQTFKPNWKLSSDTAAKSNFGNTKGGSRLALGMDSGITGERVDAIMIDDPLDAKDAPSKVVRDSVNFNYDQAIANRLASPKRSTRIVIMQRLHDEDLAGHLIAQGGWEQLCLPMEYETEGVGSQVTFIGWKDPRTKEGELLFPERFPEAVLAQERTRLGSAGYAGQMQQRPSPASGNRFKKDWWRFWSVDGQQKPRPRGCNTIPPRRFNPLIDLWDECVGSWDCSFKATDGTDFVVGIVVYRVGADKFVVFRHRARMTFTETQRAVLKMRVDFPHCYEILVEDKANGTAVVETLQSIISGVIPVEPKGGKEARAAAAEPEVEAGNIYLPEGEPWLEEWVDEFASFPLGKHDDQVDAFSQAIVKLKEESDVANARRLLGLG